MRTAKGHPSAAENAMKANAESRTEQGSAADAASHKANGKRRTANPPSSSDLTGPGGDPAEGKR
jgi:hypothetical protein